MEANPEFSKLPPLDPFRKVRREVLYAINKVRGEEGLQELAMDYFINDASTQYAEYCASTERDGNQTKLNEMLAAAGASGIYKSITGYRYLEDEEQANAKSMLSKLFLDAHGLTFEINETRDEIMKPEYTHVGIGLALLNNLYVVTEVFSAKMVTLESIKATEDEKGIEILGKVMTDQMGPYAVRVMSTSKPSQQIALVGPENMKLDLETKKFRVFLNKPDMLYNTPPHICEIYLRQKPQSIPYEGPPTADLDKNLTYLQLSFKAPMELYPDPRILMEETQDRAKAQQEELLKHTMEQEEKKAKLENIERQKRILEEGIDKMREMEKTKEDELGASYDSFPASLEPSVTRSVDSRESEDRHKKTGESVSRTSSKDLDEAKEEEEKKEEAKKEIPGLSEHEDRLRDMQEKQEREKLIRSIAVAKEEHARLKKENGDLQHDVASFLMKKEIQPAAGDASMNTLKYINALVNVTQVRVEMKKTQESYNKMAQELQEKLQYHQQRSDEMKASFRDFKRAVAESAEFNRTGKKIPKTELTKWEAEEEKVDQELQKERFSYITHKRKLKQAEEELKKKDKLAEGLHVIDFEQLKIENQTLNEKIEERNENIHSLNTKIRKGVITYTHMREKRHKLDQEIAQCNELAAQIDVKATNAETEKTNAKRDRMKEEIRLQKMRKEVGFLEVNKGGKSKTAAKLKKIGVKNLVFLIFCTKMLIGNKRS